MEQLIEDESKATPKVISLSSTTIPSTKKVVLFFLYSTLLNQPTINFLYLDKNQKQSEAQHKSKRNSTQSVSKAK